VCAPVCLQSRTPLTAHDVDVDPEKIYTVPACDGHTGENRDISYTSLKAVGNGSFGVVFQAKLIETGELTAIKKVLQDKRFKVCLKRASAGADCVRRTASCRLCAWSRIPTLCRCATFSTRTATRWAYSHCQTATDGILRRRTRFS
jgi:hypothetical protein